MYMKRQVIEYLYRYFMMNDIGNWYEVDEDLEENYNTFVYQL